MNLFYLLQYWSSYWRFFQQQQIIKMVLIRNRVIIQNINWNHTMKSLILFILFTGICFMIIQHKVQPKNYKFYSSKSVLYCVQACAQCHDIQFMQMFDKVYMGSQFRGQLSIDDEIRLVRRVQDISRYGDTKFEVIQPIRGEIQMNTNITLIYRSQSPTQNKRMNGIFVSEMQVKAKEVQLEEFKEEIQINTEQKEQQIQQEPQNENVNKQKFEYLQDSFESGGHQEQQSEQIINNEAETLQKQQNSQQQQQNTYQQIHLIDEGELVQEPIPEENAEEKQQSELVQEPEFLEPIPEENAEEKQQSELVQEPEFLEPIPEENAEEKQQSELVQELSQTEKLLQKKDEELNFQSVQQVIKVDKETDLDQIQTQSQYMFQPSNDSQIGNEDFMEDISQDEPNQINEFVQQQSQPQSLSITDFQLPLQTKSQQLQIQYEQIPVIQDATPSLNEQERELQAKESEQQLNMNQQSQQSIYVQEPPIIQKQFQRQEEILGEQKIAQDREKLEQDRINQEISNLQEINEQLKQINSQHLNPHQDDYFESEGIQHEQQSL